MRAYYLYFPSQEIVSAALAEACGRIGRLTGEVREPLDEFPDTSPPKPSASA
jgi:hypothetical protein